MSCCPTSDDEPTSDTRCFFRMLGITQQAMNVSLPLTVGSLLGCVKLPSQPGQVSHSIKLSWLVHGVMLSNKWEIWLQSIKGGRSKHDEQKLTRDCISKLHQWVEAIFSWNVESTVAFNQQMQRSLPVWIGWVKASKQVKITVPSWTSRKNSWALPVILANARVLNLDLYIPCRKEPGDRWKARLPTLGLNLAFSGCRFAGNLSMKNIGFYCFVVLYVNICNASYTMCFDVCICEAMITVQ